MSILHNAKARTIRITKPCEFGDPGDRIRPEPFDVAALLVETRGVAVYEEEPAEAGPPATPARAVTGNSEGGDRRGKRRRGPANP